MDLTTTYPRSPREKMRGIVSLARTIDKARARNAGKLGEYDYDCPHDRPLFEFLGTDGEEFARKVRELDSDDEIGQWASRRLADKTPAQIAQFNENRTQWHPEPGEHSYDYFTQLRDQTAPGRNDIVTWFDLLDADEKRPVTAPTKLKQRT